VLYLFSMVGGAPVEPSRRLVLCVMQNRGRCRAAHTKRRRINRWLAIDRAGVLVGAASSRPACVAADASGIATRVPLLGRDIQG